jgi:putative transposase
MQYNKSRHASFLLNAHIVFVTKYRKKLLSDLHHQAFRTAAGQVCAEVGVTLKECNGEEDHVHLLIDYPPSVQLTKLINSLKSVTSRRLRGEFADLVDAYQKPVLWSRSYFVSSCGGAPLEAVKEYIKNQQG